MKFISKKCQNIEKLKWILRKISLGFFLFNFIFLSNSCRSLNKSKAEKQIQIQQKNEKKQIKLDKKADKKAIKSHQKSQNKQTRKRMKTMRKKSERNRKNAKPNFLTRWFRNR